MRWFRKPHAPPPEYAKRGIARLYEYRGRYLLCPVRGISEVDAVTELDIGIDDTRLGEAAMAALLAYEAIDAQGQRDGKRTDWPAYKASGCSSVRAFERELWHIDLVIGNGAVEASARSRISAKDHLQVQAHVTVAAGAAALGIAIRDAIAGAKCLRDAGLA